MTSEIANRGGTAALVAEVIDNGKVSAQQLLVIGLCILFNMLDGFDITAMAVVASEVGSELSLQARELGWIFSFALAGMMMGAMFLAPIADLIGRRKAIIISIALIGSTVLVTSYVTNLGQFIVLRFLSGLGAGAMLASQATLAAEYSPEKYRALSVNIVTAGYPLGAMMTSVIAYYIMPEYGWRGMFYFGGSVTLLMGIVAWFFMPESLKYLLEKRPSNALERINGILKKLKKETLEKLPLQSREETAGKKNIGQSMLALLEKDQRKATIILWISFFLCFTALYFLLSWIPKLMQDAGYTPQTGRDAFFLFNLGGVIGIVSLGVLATKWKLTDLVCFFLIGAAAGMALFALVPGEKYWLLLLIFLIGITQQGGFTGLYATAAKIYPTEIRSTGVGWGIGLGRFGAVVGPALAGYLIDAGISMSGNFLIFAVPMVIGGIIAYQLHVR